MAAESAVHKMVQVHTCNTANVAAWLATMITCIFQ